MTVAAIRAAVAARVTAALPAAVLARGVVEHKREWRSCPCDWCSAKRAGTTMLTHLSHVPRYRRDELRAQLRESLRAELRGFE